MSNNTQKNNKKQENAQQDNDSSKENGRLHPGVVTAIITTLGGLFVALVTITPTLLRDFSERKYISQTQTAQVVNATQSIIVLATPTSAPTSIAVKTMPAPEQNTAIQFVAPSEDQLGAFPYLTINYIDINHPDTVNYKFTANRQETYLWTYFWCAKGESALLQNLSVMNFSFLMDEVEIPQSKFHIYRSDVNKPWNCQIWTTMLADWGGTSSTTLSVTYLISESVSDGEKSYRPGAYRQDLLLTIQ